jgi:hypothetical protein
MAFSRLTIDLAADENSAMVRLRRWKRLSRPALVAGIHVFVAGFSRQAWRGKPDHDRE